MSGPPHIVSINQSPEVLTLLELVLTDEGYRASSLFSTGVTLDALSALAPHLILIDYMWPSDDDNWALLRRIRLDRALMDVPIVLCTGAIAETRGMAEHLALMGVQILWQPFNLDQLIEAIDEALHHGAVVEPKSLHS